VTHQLARLRAAGVVVRPTPEDWAAAPGPGPGPVNRRG
jgi:hypothetical protein